ncbi:MAG: AEC family transporter [Oscillospiraceae bacterium]|nr:AEC family transporter [Oscillospiraceae bacterium]
MLQNLFTVGQQVVILFILIAVGVLLGRRRVINDTGAAVITDVVLYVVAPCVIIQAFQRPFDAAMLRGLLLSLLLAAAATVLSIALGYLCFHDKNAARRRVLRFAAVFSNCGFMGLPLQEAVLGADGLFYGSAFLVVFNLLAWTWGLAVMSGDRQILSAKKLVLNPGILGVIIAVALFLGSVTLPTVIYQPVHYLAALNTPLPMLVIGYHLSHANLRRAFTAGACWLSMALRLLIVPLLALLGMKLCGVEGTQMVSLVISVAAPVAALCTMFSAKFKNDTELSVSLVSASTLLSIITMPVVIALAQLLA